MPPRFHFPTERLAPVGRCIYCGSENDLTDEHIIAYALNGNVVLPDSSCKTCNKATTAIEQYCGRKLFLSLRTASNMQTRRPKERPKKLRIALTFTDRTETRLLNPEDHPGLYILPAYVMPGILAGRAMGEPFGNVTLHAFGQDVGKIGLHDYILSQRATGVSLEWEFDHFIFARMLAKIAHAATVSGLGLGSLRAFLPELILKQNTVMPYFVGTCVERNVVSEFGHRIQVRRIRTLPRNLIVVDIQLFAQGSTPKYCVAVGEFDASASLPPE